jgi:hypothetical protein
MHNEVVSHGKYDAGQLEKQRGVLVRKNVMDCKDDGSAPDFEDDAKTQVNGCQWQTPPLGMQNRCPAIETFRDPTKGVIPDHIAFHI